MIQLLNYALVLFCWVFCSSLRFGNADPLLSRANRKYRIPSLPRPASAEATTTASSAGCWKSPPCVWTQDDRAASFCGCWACERCSIFWLSTSLKCFSTWKRPVSLGQKRRWAPKASQTVHSRLWQPHPGPSAHRLFRPLLSVGISNEEDGHFFFAVSAKTG